MFSARHILLEYGRGKRRSAEEALWLARELRQRALDGEPFGDLARTYSDCPSANDDGSLGVFLAGDLDRDVQAAIVKLAVGEISPVVRSGLGVHVIRREPTQ
jgi:parvulin-like peptidyl-prolyl isomerase